MSTTPTSGTSPTPPTSPDLFDQIRDALSARWRRWRGASTTRFAWSKAAAFVATIAIWAYGFFYGLIALPDLAALGGVVGIVALLAVMIGPFWAVVNRRTWVRVAGVLVAFIGGAVLATQGANLPGLVANFTFASTAGMVVAVLWTAGVMVWLCRTNRLRRPRPAPAAPPTGGVATLIPPSNTP